MSKKIILITGSMNTKLSLYSQLREFVPQSIEIEAYASEEGIKSTLEGDLLIISSDNMKEELISRGIQCKFTDTIVCDRSINFDYIDQIADLPINEEVLLVNDEKETVERAINDLIEVGLNHIKYYPYYPGISNYKKLNIAITPGEPDKVPACAKKVINIGPRIIDINTLYTIIEKLQLDNLDTRLFTKRYIHKIINISKRISEINNNVNTLNGYLNNIVESLGKGILVYDESGYIKYANEEMKKVFYMERKNMENKNIKNMVDIDVLHYFLSTDSYDNKVLRLKGLNVKLSKFFIPSSKNIVVTIDKDYSENKGFNRELLLKGHVAKYNFDDIVGNSFLMKETKNTALKLSKSDLTVLIEGESGTGKELFASAIHNNSKRKNGPFIAVNFSALPDNLIESELFGYEEGAFTGAKKGGKVGLFELADGGTIFLDEIGDISPKVQTRLLRILQEKEFLPLGGTDIKGVDVRIIAATNKNLKKMVMEKQFRADLYYRLKIGYINLPPLRNRIEDMEELVNHFIRNETMEKVEVDQEVLDEFKKYKWLGNIRELESTIKYMLAVRTNNTLTLEDLPDRKFFEEEIEDFMEDNSLYFPNEIVNKDLNAILQAIGKIQSKNEIAGREKIKSTLLESGYSISEYKIRTGLEELFNNGFINKERGKHGVRLTRKGSNYIIQKNNVLF